MNKVLLAVGNKQLEEYLKKQLRNEFNFVGVTVYREGIIRSIGQTLPDIVVIRETLDGTENILGIVEEIRTRFPRIRILFLAGKREPGDALLAALVTCSVYDIMYGEKTQAQEIIALMRKPNEYKDVQHLRPRQIFDEKHNKVLFEAPDVSTKEVVKEVERIVYVETGKPESSKEEKAPSNPKITPLVEDDGKSDDSQKPLELKKEEEEEVKEVETKEEVATPPVTEKQEQQSLPVQQETKKPKEKKGMFDKLFGGKSTSSSGSAFDTVTGKQKIVSFLGSKSGVGNSSVALNVAVGLASKKQRVLFIEVNERTPSVNYWYELGHVEHGIDDAIKGLGQRDFERVERSIVRSSDLRKLETPMQKNYKRFPVGLDFMFFSTQYLTRKKVENKEVDLSLTKDLYLHLLYQMEYDYIILDVSSDLENEAVLNALVYSNKLFLTVTQDVSTVGNAVFILNELSKQGVQVSKKLNLIVNKFEQAEIGISDICEWVKIDELLTIPCENKEFINANFVGLPVVLATKSSQLKHAFNSIEKNIL